MAKTTVKPDVNRPVIHIILKLAVLSMGLLRKKC
jgi:hypothetical protein